MLNARRLAALLPFLCLAAAPLRVSAGPVDLDAGLRASIYDDNYNLGVGGELGLVFPSASAWDFGLHLNYSHFDSKVPEILKDLSEYGGYAAAYFKPTMNQAFSMRLGPHLGYAYIAVHYVDVGGDAVVLFKATPSLTFYSAFIPSFMIGKDGQTLVRIGLGLEYNAGR
ncbi:MAG: hypothetical protein ABI036_20435 [Fibrobacteria bacterium]